LKEDSFAFLLIRWAGRVIFGKVASVDTGSILEIAGDSRIADNDAIGGFGGGVFMRMGTMTLTDSTVSGNTAGLDTAAYGAIEIYHAGGGISTFSQGPGNTFGPLNITITNSFITDNVLSNDNVGSLPFPYGGGAVTCSHSSWTTCFIDERVEPYWRGRR
jgi:hypothetical protein